MRGVVGLLLSRRRARGLVTTDTIIPRRDDLPLRMCVHIMTHNPKN
jgi:hypothetical protein